MKLFEMIGVAVVAALATYFGLQFLPERGENANKWVGEVKAVNKQIAVEVPVAFHKLHWDHKGAGKGAMLFHSDFTFEFGVDFPKNWKYKAKRNEDGSVDIKVPELSLLNQIKIEFRDQTEEDICNKASGKRLLRMLRDVKSEARTVFEDKARDYLETNRNIYQLSRRSLEKSYLLFLNSVNKENPVTAVNVTFEGEPDFPQL